jgi:predicted transcriptional regulator
MTSQQVYGHLAIREKSAQDIADELQVSVQIVRAAITGGRTSGSLARLIRRHIAQLIEVDVSELPGFSVVEQKAA